jgi:uncharacterized membrane protein
VINSIAALVFLTVSLGLRVLAVWLNRESAEVADSVANYLHYIGLVVLLASLL